MWSVPGILALASVTSFAPAGNSQAVEQRGSSSWETSAHTSLARLPLVFVENVGQWESPARFVARRRGGATLYLAPDSIWLQLVRREAHPPADSPPPPLLPRGGGDLADLERTVGVNLRLVFEGSTEGVRLVGRGETPTLFHYFLGNDPSRWRTDVRGYEQVAYDGLYEGVDLVVREEDSALEYDLLLGPGADLSRAIVRVEGASGPLRLDAEGTLVIDTALGEIRQPTPRAWEEAQGVGRRALECSYRILGGERFGFEAPRRTEGFALVVDPQLLYSTFLGGAGVDVASALSLDATGAAVVAGYTVSPNFLTTPGAFDTTFGGVYYDAFVTRLPLSGGPPSYSTFLGGSGADYAQALALDATGSAVVAGQTSSSDFPTTAGAFDTTFSGLADAFVTRLPLSGGPPSYSTFLGGFGNDDAACALALDATGAVVVAGRTDSSNFPTTPGAFDPTLNGFQDAFVTRLPLSGGPPSYSTFLGGAVYDGAQALALDATGAAVVAGDTYSGNFPTTPGALDTTYNGFGDAFITRLPLSGGPPSYSTFLGGAALLGDGAYALALDPTGAAVVAGYTYSPDFPTTPGALDTTLNNGTIAVSDAFVTRLPLSGGLPSYSTFLGGSGYDEAWALALDATGVAVVAGFTNSFDFPTTPGAFDPIYNDGFFPGDAFVSRLPLPGGALSYSTFLGGADEDVARALALDATDAAVVVGATGSPDFPATPGAFDTTLNGGDAFVSQLDLLPAGASTYGTSTPGCAGPLPIGVASIPQVGNAAFAITCAKAPSATPGLLGVALSPASVPFFVAGALVWIDPPQVILSAASNAIGASQVAIPVPANALLVGGQAFAQFFWPDPCALGGISASNALAILVQP